MKRYDLKAVREWKVGLLFVGLFAAFLLLAGIFEGSAMLIPSTAVSVAISVAGSVVVMEVYRFVLRKIDTDTFTVSLRSLPKNILVGFGIGFGFFVAVVAVLWVAGCYTITAIAYSPDVIRMLAAYLLVGCCEEVISRGLMLRMFEIKWGFPTALVVSSLIFGFMHLPNDNATVWSCLAISIEAGLLFGVAYKASGSLWLPIGIHWGWNFTQGPLLGFSVSGESMFENLTVASISGPSWLTGGGFGPEASVVSVLFGIALTVLFARKIDWHNS